MPMRQRSGSGRKLLDPPAVSLTGAAACTGDGPLAPNGSIGSGAVSLVVGSVDGGCDNATVAVAATRKPMQAPTQIAPRISASLFVNDQIQPVAPTRS